MKNTFWDCSANIYINIYAIHLRLLFVRWYTKLKFFQIQNRHLRFGKFLQDVGHELRWPIRMLSWYSKTQISSLLLTQIKRACSIDQPRNACHEFWRPKSAWCIFLQNIYKQSGPSFASINVVVRGGRQRKGGAMWIVEALRVYNMQMHTHVTDTHKHILYPSNAQSSISSSLSREK